MAFIDGTAVNVALPALQNALHATVSDVQWVIESYALLLARALSGLVRSPPGDRFGRRKVFLTIGVVVFAAASAWCGFAETIHHADLCAWRAGCRRGAAATGQPVVDYRVVRGVPNEGARIRFYGQALQR